MQPADQDDLTLRLWEGDDSAKGDLLRAWGGKILRAIGKRYPRLSEHDREDVVAEAIARFWQYYREIYDPALGTIGTLLYKIAVGVASERATGRYAWQKAMLKEHGHDAEFFARIEVNEPDEEPPDDVGAEKSPVQSALAECFDALSALQQDILFSYGSARANSLDASVVGRDLGNKHKNGVPIPAGTIRTNKSRAWDLLDKCMRKKGFDLNALGYTNE